MDYKTQKIIVVFQYPNGKFTTCRPSVIVIFKQLSSQSNLKMGLLLLFEAVCSVSRVCQLAPLLLYFTQLFIFFRNYVFNKNVLS